MTRRTVVPALASVLILAVSLSRARGDEVLFNNGDRLSGKVLGIEGGKLKIKTTVAGELTVELKDVKTFTTDEPIEVRTKDGEVVTAPAIGADEAGVVTVKPSAEEAEAKEIRLDDVKYVNFNQDWTGAVVAGALVSRGNTHVTQANVSAEAIRRTLDDRITLGAAYSFGRQKDNDTGEKETTVDNWFAAGKYDYFLNEKLYLFAALRYERDRIAELDRRVVPSIGVGYLWFDEADFKFDTEAGLAFVHEKFEDGDTNDAMSGRIAYHLKKDLWDDKVGLFHNLEYYPSLERLDDFLVIADGGVRAAMTEQMFAEYKLEYRYDATPAEGLHKTDLRHVVGVGWKF